MLRSLKAIGVSGAMIVTAMACQQQATEQTGATEEDIATGADVAATIDERNTALEQAMLGGDVEGMVAGYAPDAVLQPPMMPASSGTESIRALFAGMVEEGPPASFDIVSDNVIVAESGELAYETGHYTVSGQEPEGEVWEDQGKYLTVWKKGADGQWQTAALSWSPNAAPPAMDHAESGTTAPSAETDAGTTEPAPAGETKIYRVQRGDYVTHPDFRLLEADYYAQAAELLRARVTAPCFVVFSDDPEWARENLKLPEPVIWSFDHGRHSALQDFRMMKACKHFITANSSFSFWPAWLGQHPGKTVACPARWFRNPEWSADELRAPDWIAL